MGSEQGWEVGRPAPTPHSKPAQNRAERRRSASAWPGGTFSLRAASKQAGMARAAANARRGARLPSVGTASATLQLQLQWWAAPAALSPSCFHDCHLALFTTDQPHGLGSLHGPCRGAGASTHLACALAAAGERPPTRRAVAQASLPQPTAVGQRSGGWRLQPARQPTTVACWCSEYSSSLLSSVSDPPSAAGRRRRGRERRWEEGGGGWAAALAESQLLTLRDVGGRLGELVGIGQRALRLLRLRRQGGASRWLAGAPGEPGPAWLGGDHSRARAAGLPVSAPPKQGSSVRAASAHHLRCAAPQPTGGVIGAGMVRMELPPPSFMGLRGGPAAHLPRLETNARLWPLPALAGVSLKCSDKPRGSACRCARWMAPLTGGVSEAGAHREQRGGSRGGGGSRGPLCLHKERGPAAGAAAWRRQGGGKHWLMEKSRAHGKRGKG